MVLTALLRPDPLLHARAQQSTHAADPEPATASATASDTVITAAEAPPTPRESGSRAVLAGGITMVVTQLVMVAIMTMTPVHILEHGHGVAAAGLIIAIHIAAMYLPAPLSGWLVDRYGSTPAAVLAGTVLLAAGLIAALAPWDVTGSPRDRSCPARCRLEHRPAQRHRRTCRRPRSGDDGPNPGPGRRRGRPRRCGRRVRLGPHGRHQQLRRPCPHRWSTWHRHPHRRGHR
ncbi:MFS transporter [Pseudonocardia charpentierae]|uniref:MFS transporter n=1 Tax=Pseudonocardia charpentierae TaxID=3075545 RepID=UPI0037C5F0BE